MRKFALAATLALLPGSLLAGEKISGTDYFVVTQESWETGEGSGSYEWRGEGVQQPTTGPLEPGPIECRGSGFWSETGSRGEGICIAGAGEDTRTYRWWREQNAEVGHWVVLSAGGKYAGMTGEGTFTSRPLPGSRQISDWEGEIALPE